MSKAKIERLTAILAANGKGSKSFVQRLIRTQPEVCRELLSLYPEKPTRIR